MAGVWTQYIFTSKWHDIQTNFDPIIDWFSIIAEHVGNSYFLTKSRTYRVKPLNFKKNQGSIKFASLMVVL